MLGTTAVALALLAAMACATPPRSAQHNPVAAESAIVTLGRARFTVLTESLLRIEWSGRLERGWSFDNAATSIVLNRLLPVPSFHVDSDGTSVRIKTPNLYLSYTPGDDGQTAFNATNLRVEVNRAPAGAWVPGKVDEGNLLGTLRTLDSWKGPRELDCRRNPDAESLYCAYGVLSRGGWAVVDDTRSVILDDDWLLEGSRNDTYDVYLFGHGLDYKRALADYALVSGRIPVPPRYAFGVYFSRWWGFNDKGTKNIVEEYVAHNTPLDVVVTDMDWHQTFYKEADQGKVDQAGQMMGWTGHTWDKHLFPNPKAFFDWCKRKGLRNTLNLHPASGLQPWEEKYEEMARAMGIDPSTGKYVPYNLTDKKFALNYMDRVLQPITEQGLDFWWLDWQQWTNGNPNPTFWLNHVFFNNRERRGEPERGMLLHRWGGMGNHRYQVGFSGDVIPSWDSLAFQPYFTLTAANVLYGYWSHDLGGHTAPVDPELYVRWVQWGAWSPVFRTHCTKDPNNDRRLWVYPLQYFMTMRRAAQMRSQMVPYIYTQAHAAHETAISLVHPLYYDYPDLDAAYSYMKSQYMFGSDILVAPVVSPIDTTRKLAVQSLWVPPGYWVEMESGQVFSGPTEVKRFYTLEETPVFARAGAIIPKLTKNKPLLGSAQKPFSALLLEVYVAGGAVASGSSQIYEDDGLTSDYLRGKFSVTNASWRSTKEKLYVNVAPVTGDFVGAPSTRTYDIAVIGVLPPKAVEVDGFQLLYDADFDEPKRGSWSYDGNSLTLLISAPTRSSTSTLAIDITLAESLKQLPRWTRCLTRLQSIKELLDQQWGKGVYPEDYEVLLNANEAGERVSAEPTTAKAEYSVFEDALSNAHKAIEDNQALDNQVKQQILAYISSC